MSCFATVLSWKEDLPSRTSQKGFTRCPTPCSTAPGTRARAASLPEYEVRTAQLFTDHHSQDHHFRPFIRNISVDASSHYYTQWYWIECVLILYTLHTLHHHCCVLKNPISEFHIGLFIMCNSKYIFTNNQYSYCSICNVIQGLPESESLSSLHIQGICFGA